MAVTGVTGPTSRVEGSGGGASVFTFTVTRDRIDDGGQYSYSTFADSGSYNEADVVDPNTVLGSAEVSNQFYFAPGSLATNIDFLVRADDSTEPDEGFFFLVGTANQNNSFFNYVASAQSTIINDDGEAFYFSVKDVSIGEGDSGSKTGFFTITRNAATISASVDFAFSENTSSGGHPAIRGIDFTAPSPGTIMFAIGQTSAIVNFQVLGDTIVEGNESFRFNISNPSNGAALFGDIATATIIDDDNATGRQVGTFGDDILISTNRGNSVLIGGPGDDTYLVYSQGDSVVEPVGGGDDTIYTTISYNLGESQVETLSTAVHLSTGAINLIGNYFSQTIIGNYGSNILNGGSGADTLIGLFGDDTYAVGDSRIVIQEQAGQGTDIVVTSVSYALKSGVSIESLVAQDRASTAPINLTGNELAQTIGGSAGVNVIDGGLGADVLVGFGGADTFAFTTTLGNGNVDTLVDFTGGTDKIGLSTGIFTALGATLDNGEFVSGVTATTADQHIVYDAGTGRVFYDADGSGANSAVLFAQVAPGTVLTANDFVMVPPTTTAA